MDAAVVANFFILKASADEDVLTQLKLQKLLYYAQAWHMVFLGRPIIDEQFQAWAHGPVLRSIWGRFPHGLNPTMTQVQCNGTLPNDSIEVLNSVWSAYGFLNAKALEELTHQEDPWIEARAGCEPEERSENIINLETMRRFYTNYQRRLATTTA